MVNIYHYLAPLPTGVKEVVMPCYDGYTIYTAEWLSSAEREEAIHHAMKHIERNDWEKDDVQQIEKEVRE